MAKPRKQTVLKSNVREWHVKRALESMVSLAEISRDLTLDEVLYCLDLESQSQRRKSVMATLIRLAAKLNKRIYIQSLKETYYG